MNYWDSVGRWINTLLVFIVGVLAFDALFRLLEANRSNVIVSSVHALSVAFLVPFQGMFGEQDFVLTTLIGVLGYSLLAGIALGVLRSLQASRAQPAPPVREQAPSRVAGIPSVEPRHPPAPASKALPPTAGATRRPPTQATGNGPAPSAAANAPAPPPPGNAEQRKPERTQSGSTEPPEPAPQREAGDEQQRANGRQRSLRSGADGRAPVRRDGRVRRRMDRRSAPRGSNG